MNLKIYLFRHGQTYYNRDKKFTGWKDSKLTPQGQRDAFKIAVKLKKKKIDFAFCSHLTRSKDTLAIVLQYHPECESIKVDDRMIERSYGKLEGKKHHSFIHDMGEEIYKSLEHWHKIDHLHGKERADFEEKVGLAEFDIIHRSYNHPPPGGESVKMVEKRVGAFIKDLLKLMKMNKVNVAISAHGNSMRPFRKYFEKLSLQEMMKLENPWDDYFEYTIKI